MNDIASYTMMDLNDSGKSHIRDIDRQHYFGMKKVLFDCRLKRLHNYLSFVFKLMNHWSSLLSRMKRKWIFEKPLTNKDAKAPKKTNHSIGTIFRQQKKYIIISSITSGSWIITGPELAGKVFIWILFIQQPSKITLFQNPYDIRLFNHFV